MRHRNRGRKLGLRTAPRLALLRQLVEALFLHGRVRTTVTRAKEARRLAERLVTWAKRGTLHHRRLALAVLYRPDVVHRLFDTIVEWYRDRPGGYTRIIKLGMRPGDGAPMAFLELVDWVPGEKLEGQVTKVIKKVEGEEGKEGKEAKGEKGKKVKEPKKPEDKKAKAPAKAEHKPKHAKDPEKEKKKSERQATLAKQKQERAAAREKLRKEQGERKGKGGEKLAVKPARSDKGGKK
jgi:large subunit ribosomal protein L17